MEYRTCFYLSTDAPIPDMNRAAIRDLRQYSEDAEYALDENGGCSDECKWYEFEEHMRWVSEKWPLLLFTLEGAGEDSDDRWKLYAKGGKTQIAPCLFIYPEFDESKLR